MAFYRRQRETGIFYEICGIFLAMEWKLVTLTSVGGEPTDLDKEAGAKVTGNAIGPDSGRRVRKRPRPVGPSGHWAGNTSNTIWHRK